MIENINRAWGYFIAKHPWWHIIGSLVVTFLLSIHIYQLHIEHDIHASFSPKNSRSAYENSIYKEFYNLNLTSTPQRTFVLFTAKDNGSMLRRPQLEEVHKLDSHLTDSLGIVDNITRVPRCHPLCKINKPFYLISNALQKAYNNETDGEVILDYPLSFFHGTPLFVGMNMLEVHTSDFIFPENNSKIIYAKRLILWYFSRADTHDSLESYKVLTWDLFQKSQNSSYFNYINFEIFGGEIANREMIRGAIEATVLMTIGFLLLLLFVFVSVYQRLSQGYKALAVPIVVAISVLCPLLGSVAAFGVLTFIGYDTYAIMCVIPFLVLGIGVDDAFIIIKSWNQNKEIKSRSHRLATVFVNVGPSITITSLTNTVAFGIGFATPTPQMSLFCFCTSMAVFFDYIFTFTLLAPIIFLMTPEGKATPENGNISNGKAYHDHISHATSTKQPLSMPIYYYTKFIYSNVGHLTAVILAIVLYIIAYTGVVTMKASFEPSKAFPSDSPLALSIDSVRSVFNEFFPINIIVHRPPNISNTHEYDRFYDMVTSLESLPESYDRNRTLLWLIPYEKVDRQATDLMRFFGYDKQYIPSYDNLDFFLDYAGYPPTIRFKKDEKNKTVVTAFEFTIIARDMAEWANRAVFEEKCRDIIIKYPEFNATLYDGDSSILALLLSVKNNVIFSIAVTIACMTVICSLFIYNQIGVMLIALTISSICFSTGFSVDYTAHIAHQYYVKIGSREERIGHSLNEMCVPMLQDGISTILCMLPLIFVSTYVIVAFAKTVFIVVGVGLLHGLFFLPILLYILPEQILCFGRCGVCHENPTNTQEINETKQLFLMRETEQN